MALLRVAAALVLVVQAGYLAFLAYLGRALEGWSTDPTDRPDPAVTWLYLSALATVVTLAVGLLPVPRQRIRALEAAVLAVLAAAVTGDAALIVLLGRWHGPAVLLAVCGLGTLAYLALMYARVGDAKGSAARRREPVG
jgi:hypothetical protein